MAPYAVAHLKLGMQLHETGYAFKSDQRLGIYLTNTLEQAVVRGEQLFASWVSAEANDAAAIKRERPILVVLGNPPYSGHSANRSRDDQGNLTFIGGLIEDYKRDCPELMKPAQAEVASRRLREVHTVCSVACCTDWRGCHRLHHESRLFGQPHIQRNAEKSSRRICRDMGLRSARQREEEGTFSKRRTGPEYLRHPTGRVHSAVREGTWCGRRCDGTSR